jgi:uncharacterized protein
MADTKEEIICPACGTKMVKVLTSIGINVDVCVNGCGGIWFDNRELEKFDESEENLEEIEKILVEKTFKKVDENVQRICPVCNRKMVAHQPSPNCEVIIDDCYNCGGKFLDYKEIDKIRESKPTEKEKVDEIVKALYLKNGYVSYKAKEEPLRGFLKDVYTRFN